MTKKLLFLLDTDPAPSVFDTVVGYDGGADHIIGYGGVTPESVAALVDGTIYTRGPKEKQYTAAAGVALLAKAKPLAGKKAIVLAGTGPVGMRAAAMLHIEGAEVALTSRSQQRADAASKAINDRFGFAPTPIEAFDNAARAAAVKDAQVLFAAGAIGIPLLDEKDWQNDQTIELIADCNAQPPLGIGGVEAIDKAKERHGKIVIGALGLGGLKLKLHRACVGQLFESSDQVLDAENIYAQAKALA